MRPMIVLLALLLSHARAPSREGFTPIPEPAIARTAWSELLRCTASLGITIESGGDLSNVQWFVAKLPHTRTSAAFGFWAPPDTIVIDERVVNEIGVVEHELLHHLLRGPPPPFEMHPYVPFAAPCRLMLYQRAHIDIATGVVTFSGHRYEPRDQETKP